jgi:redox-sensitive bicupin YhaK (pirin superfamily)
MNKENYIVHKNNDRHFSEHGWLKSAFSFSFANWYDEARMGFGTLRVINDDSIAPNNGFGFHPHQDMEIVTLMLEGELTHKDTMGNSEVIKPGEVQRMSAGTGVLHSEINEHNNKSAKLFQIWIETKKKGIKPSYEQKYFDEKNRKNTFQLLVSPNGTKESIKIHQDAYFSRINLEKDKEIKYTKYNSENVMYIILISGITQIHDIELQKRDAIAISNENNIQLMAKETSDILLIEIPKK